MYTYKNVSDLPLSVPNVGVVQPGENIESEMPLNNPNLEPVKAPKQEPKKD